MTEKPIVIEQWMIDLLEEAEEKAFNILVEQMNTNPDAIGALYGDETV